jgi:hypothetical protein
MPRRPALATATAALCALTALTACQGSPEAGRPNTAPAPSTSATSTPTPTATSPSSPSWTPAEQAAITAAKARYIAARAAVNNAFKEPAKATTTSLEAAGNGGTWVIAVAGQLDFQVKNGWYQTGDARVSSLDVRSVNLKLEQPEVRLTSCIDSSQVVDRYQSNSKPIPVASNNGDRHRFESRLVYANSAATGRKLWFLVDEKTTTTC